MQDAYEVRPFRPEDAAPLTGLLHRAYAPLGARGLNYTAVDQDVATTHRRASGGACWVVVDRSDRLVATLTMSLPPEAALRDLTAAAREPGRAWLNQVAVEPDLQGTGLARLLWREGLSWAARAGATSVGVDTAEPAEQLLRLYAGWGFVREDVVQWPGKTYRSVVMVRPSVRPAPAATRVDDVIPPWVLQQDDARRDVRPGDVVVVEEEHDVGGRGRLVVGVARAVTDDAVRLAAPGGRRDADPWWPRHRVVARATWPQVLPDVDPGDLAAWLRAAPRPPLRP